jgi:hypothetical protein
MSDQPTQLESDGYPGSHTNSVFSANGTAPEDEPASASDAGAPVPAAGAESTTPTVTADAEPVAEAEPATAEQAGGATLDEGAAFVAALSQAMRDTAAAEKSRVIAEMDARREALIADVAARRDAGTTRMRDLADEDIKAIDAWADAERERIQSERERRVQVVRADLDLSLTQHGSRIDREIEGVDSAIAAYRADVEAFFTALERETPLAVAQQAGRRPVFPSVETIVAAEPAEAPAAPTPIAVDETAAPTSDLGETPATEPAAEAETVAVAAPAVGVMDEESLAKPVGSWRAWTETTATADAGTSTADPASSSDGEAPDTTEPVQFPVAAGAYRPESGNLVHAMPVSRPMSWLRRDREPGDDTH